MKTLLTACLFLALNVNAAHFPTGSDVPNEELNKELVSLYREKMKNLPKDELITVEGHTDTRGSEVYNKKLSEKRAKSVADFFKHLGFTNVKSSGLGESAPDDLGNSLESHAKNRRVVVKFNGTNNVISESDKKEEKKNCVERVVYKKKTIKNIISLKAINSYQNPRASANGNKGKASVSRETNLGIQYQRNVGNDVFVGVEADLNESVGVLLGVGF